MSFIRRSRSASRRRTRHSNTERYGEIDAQRVTSLWTLPTADQANHWTSRSKLEGKPQTLGAIIFNVFGNLTAATQRTKIFDCTSAKVCRRLCDRGREVCPVCGKSKCIEIVRYSFAMMILLGVSIVFKLIGFRVATWHIILGYNSFCKCLEHILFLFIYILIQMI